MTERLAKLHPMTTFDPTRRADSSPPGSPLAQLPGMLRGRYARNRGLPKIKMLAPGGWGAKNLRDYNYSMVMEVDGRVELSGQGGWDPETLDFPVGRSIEAEINQAFDNVAFMLNAIGLDWRNVAHVNS